MIIDISELDKCDIKTVRYESDREGHQNINALISEFNSGKNRFDKTGEKLVGFILDNKIVGVCGLNIEPDNDKLGRLRRLYVLRRYRHRGIGSKLVKYLVKHSREHFEGVVVNIGDLDNGGFYEELGFKPMMNNKAYTHIFLNCSD